MKKRGPTFSLLSPFLRRWHPFFFDSAATILPLSAKKDSPTAATAATRRFLGFEVIRSAAEAGRSVAAAAAAATAGRRVCRAISERQVGDSSVPSQRPLCVPCPRLGLESDSRDRARSNLSFVEEKGDENPRQREEGGETTRGGVVSRSGTDESFVSESGDDDFFFSFFRRIFCPHIFFLTSRGDFVSRRFRLSR